MRPESDLALTGVSLHASKKLVVRVFRVVPRPTSLNHSYRAVHSASVNTCNDATPRRVSIRYNEDIPAEHEL